MFSDVDVSIIIVNYNTNDLVIQCINSVLLHTKNIEFEIIVVDNNSPDRKIEGLNDVFPNVKLILNDSNSGFGAANNLGAKFALGKYIFLLNSDTIILDNSIYYLYKFMSDHNNAGACGGNLCDINLQPATSFTRWMPSILSDVDYFFINIISKLIYRKNTYYCYSNSPIKINGNISGADLMISKQVYDNLGGFDENFFMYYEETDLLFRIRKMKYETFIVPQSKIIHLEGASESIQSNRLNWTYESKRKYYLKNKSKMQFLISNQIFYLTILQRILLFKVIGNKSKFKYWLDFYNWFKNK